MCRLRISAYEVRGTVQNVNVKVLDHKVMILFYCILVEYL